MKIEREQDEGKIKKVREMRMEWNLKKERMRI